MIDWIISNREWVFSGVGVAVVTAVLSLIRKKQDKNKDATKTATAGANSMIIQSEGNVTIGSKTKSS